MANNLNWKDGSNGNNLPQDVAAPLQAARDKRNEGAVAKYTPEIAAIILEGLENGLTIPQACKEAGIAESTYHRWRVLLPAFQEAIVRAHKAQAEARMYKHQHLMESIDVDKLDPKLAMAHLRRQEQAARLDLEIAKRRDPATWGDKIQSQNLNITATIAPVDLSRFQ